MRHRPLNRIVFRGLPLSLLVPAILATTAADTSAQQRIDEEYTRLIAEHLTDARISTELVDYLPASDVVPTTLDFPGIERIVGTPGELTYAADIHRYLQAVAEAAPERARYMVMGQSEEGRDVVVLMISDEETIANLETYRGYLQTLTDPRVTTEEEARRIIDVAKPIYWLTSGLHSTERGGPEMLMELAYRLVVDESEFIREIRDNVITFITPVLEPDGRERMVDTYHFNNRRQEEGLSGNLPLMYWGKYVQHDNNRDGMGQFLALTRHSTTLALEWTPTIMHDLHEQQTLLYSSTGTGPYNEGVDAITINEWWMFAQNDVMEMTKRNVPGVWTYNFYDGWTPNYLFFAAHSHNATGRFYEVASYGPNNRTIRANQSREWFRPNPLQGEVQWGPRANTNIQQSGVLFSLHFTATDREKWLENYWIKNKRAVARGTTEGNVAAWVIPASQHSSADAAMAVNDMIDQGVEFHTADRDFEIGEFQVRQGDWIIRGDQPYRTVADIYFSVQRFPLTNPSPYDDLGWTFSYMRDIVVDEVDDAAILTEPMSPVAGHIMAAGGISGSGSTVVVSHTGDNNMVTLRFRFADVAMSAAETDFEVDGETFPAGSFIIPNANRGQLEPVLTELGLSGHGVGSIPADLPTHDLDVPRIGYVHSWSRTQDEGWVRAALDYYEVPYTYFGENEVHRRDLRAEFDVIIYPVGGSVGSLPTDGDPIPYQRTDEYQSFGRPDMTDDVRGQLGREGLQVLYDFVEAGGTVIAEGSAAAIFPNYDLTPGLEVAQTSELFARGSVFRGVVEDATSPLAYGIGRNQLPVYFSSSPVFDAGMAQAPQPEASAAGRGGGRGGRGGVYQNTQPMASAGQVPVSEFDPRSEWPQEGSVEASVAAGGPTVGGGGGRGGRGGGRGGFGRGGGGGPQVLPGAEPRVILRFPAYEGDMLLSGMLQGGDQLSNRAQLVDVPAGDGHMVLFAIRPFWRWQTQGTFVIGFNAILNWNDLDAGRDAMD